MNKIRNGLMILAPKLTFVSIIQVISLQKFQINKSHLPREVFNIKCGQFNLAKRTDHAKCWKGKVPYNVFGFQKLKIVHSWNSDYSVYFISIFTCYCLSCHFCCLFNCIIQTVRQTSVELLAIPCTCTSTITTVLPDYLATYYQS